VLLKAGWQADVIAVNGERVTLHFPNWDANVDVHVRDIECVGAAHGETE
jgi:hypothetical protein